MEKRQDVDVLMKAARHLYEQRNRRDFHFLIVDNKEGEEQEYGVLEILCQFFKMQRNAERRIDYDRRI